MNFRCISSTLCPILEALHAESAHCAAALLAGRFALHLLADLDVDLKELGNAAIKADGFAFVQITLAVVSGDTLCRARLS
jgi:hypothetical protein